MTFALGLALLAEAALSPGDRTTIDAAIDAFFAPYSQAEPDATPPWERPIYSAEVRALIAHWQRVMPKDEVDALNDGDWLCQCQEFDAHAFRAIPLSTRRLRDGTADVRLTVELGYDARRPTRLLLKREGDGWRIDDLFGPDFPKGLKRKLRDTIKQDEAL